MKALRILWRSALLLLAAAAFVGLTHIYGGSAHPALPNPGAMAARLHRPAAPQIGYLPEFAGEAILLAMCAVIGRLLFRLRLSPAPRREKEPVQLNLPRPPRTRKASE